LRLFIIFLILGVSFSTGYSQKADNKVWNCYKSYYDSVGINIKSELDIWENYLIKNGLLSNKSWKSLSQFISESVKDRKFAWFTDCRSSCIYKDLNLSIDPFYQSGKPVECMWASLKNTSPDIFDKMESAYEDSGYPPVYLSVLVNEIGDDIAKPEFKYPLLEATYRLSFDRAYLVAQKEQELGLDPKAIHGSPTSVMQAVFKAARGRDVSVLKFLCDPYGENDGDVRMICHTPEWPEWEKDEFVNYFKNGEITGESTQKLENRAEVHFTFLRGKETMRLVKRGDMWFLASF